ncbi:MAG: LD-carboxypeptidase [Fimbriimonas ginsengisoli]|uniref:LD-carboxypeptidase n=1 Tax=Fimbriimonas ginsengisoli TaxID=1005039 RepID=A0A931LRJ0_FIMGI|nr:LD-carboxypeptidase [Fimbriimonas ginsengisoli]
MRKPRALRAGDTVRVVSPASPLPEEKLAAMEELLRAQGLRVAYGRHALGSQDYFAGSDKERAADLQQAFDDPDCAAVLCSRGGYGCARLMRMLDLDRMAGSGKMLLGYSDITTLHLALLRRGLATVYSPMSITFHTPREPWVYQSFLAVLSGGNPIPPEAPRARTITPGIAEGEVTGGCLCLLTDSLATPDLLDARGKILIIEDVDEQPHRVDAMFTHLLLAGVLESAAGIAVGEMTHTDEQCDPLIGSRPWEDIVRERIAPLGIPAVVGFPFGHMQAMLTLPLGIRARLDADAGTLTYLESICDASR